MTVLDGVLLAVEVLTIFFGLAACSALSASRQGYRPRGPGISKRHPPTGGSAVVSSRKGGINPQPSQIIERPAPPGPMKPAR